MHLKESCINTSHVHVTPILFFSNQYKVFTSVQFTIFIKFCVINVQ